MLRHCAAQLNKELVLLTPSTEDANLHIDPTASLTYIIDFFDGAERDVRPVGSTSEPPFGNGVFLAWVRSLRRPTDSCLAGIKKAHSSFFTFLLAAIISAEHHAYVFLSARDVQTLRRIV